MKIAIDNGRLVDQAGGLDHVASLYVAAGRIVVNMPDETDE